MTRRKSVQQFVNPLRKLTFITPQPFQPDLEFVPEQDVEQAVAAVKAEMDDFLTLFPREVILQILSLLSFQDLIKVQLVSPFTLFFPT